MNTRGWSHHGDRFAGAVATQHPDKPTAREGAAYSIPKSVGRVATLFVHWQADHPALLRAGSSVKWAIGKRPPSEAYHWRERLLTERLMRDFTTVHERVLLLLRDMIEAGDTEPSHG
jgi:hypothetical protein